MMGTVEDPRVDRGTRLLLLLRVPPEGLPERTTRDPYNGPRRVDWYELPDTAPHWTEPELRQLWDEHCALAATGMTVPRFYEVLLPP